MHNQKMVVAIKTKGKILREIGDEVKLPFGNEFSILLKNLNNVRAVANITIDGTEVTNPGGLVIDANSEVDLERFLTNNNLTGGNKFKFIERNDTVEATRGIKLEDGLVRVEFRYAKPVTASIFQPNFWHDYHKERTVYGSPGPVGSPKWGNSTVRNHIGANSVGVAQSFLSNDAGITVPGSVSTQQVVSVSGFETEEQSYVIVLKLVGMVDTVPVEKPVTIKSKPKCTTCHTTNKASARFCSKCGTGLVLV